MASKLTLPELLEDCKRKFPDGLRSDFWYIATASALVTASSPQYLGELFNHLAGEDGSVAPERRRIISRRLRGFCMKIWVSIGAPRAADAFLSLLSAEKPGDADLSFTKKHNEINSMTRQRGTEFLHTVYGEETVTKMFKAWGADMEWLTRDVTYGLFFSDDGVFDDLESELINYISILSQGLKRPALAHLQGLKRMGVKAEDAQRVDDCTKAVCEWAGQDTSSWRPVTEQLSWV